MRTGTRGEADRVGPFHWWVQAAMILSLSLVGLAWTLASAPLSAPDDDFHLASIWCAWGHESSGCLEGDPVTPLAARAVIVPSLSDHTSPCMARQPEQSGSCIYTDENSASGAGQFPTRANNGGYPPGFYSYLRLFVSDNTVLSLAATRMGGFFLASALVIASGLMLPREDRDRAWLFLLFVLMPTGLFFMASTNPSGVGIAAVGATFAALRSGFLVVGTRRMYASAAIGLASTFVAIQSRPDSVWFCGLAAFAAFLSSEAWRIVGSRRFFIVVGPTIGLLAAHLLLGQQHVADYRPEPIAGDRPALMIQNLANLTNLYLGDFATRLGWLDVAMPGAVNGVQALAFGYVLTLGLMAADRGKAASIAALGLVMVVYPLVLLDQFNSVVTENVQARYLMPLTVIAALTLALGLPTSLRRSAAGVTLLMAVAVAFAHSLALHTLIRRYVTGVDVDGLDLSTGAEWWWPFPAGPDLVWFFGSVAFAVLSVLLAWRASAADGRAQGPA